jgi:hypothetical protein
MLVFVLLGQSQPASAASAVVYTVHIHDTTIPWVFPPPEGLSGSFCTAIPEDVNINPDDNASDRLKTATETVMPDGVKEVSISDLITGTASDDSGAAYTFIYLNVATYHFDGSTVRVHMRDFFTLQGEAVTLTVGFSYRWAYPADSFEVVQVRDEQGTLVDVGVDPFFFATNDGVNEDPNIVPGSWEKVSTRGDWMNCDPL